MDLTQTQVLLLPMTINELKDVIKRAVNEAMAQSKDNDLLNAEQVCDLLGISLSTLNVWKRKNKIPYKRMGKRVFFEKNEVMGALKQSNYYKLRELGA